MYSSHARSRRAAPRSAALRRAAPARRRVGTHVATAAARRSASQRCSVQAEAYFARKRAAAEAEAAAARATSSAGVADALEARYPALKMDRPLKMEEQARGRAVMDCECTSSALNAHLLGASTRELLARSYLKAPVGQELVVTSAG